MSHIATIGTNVATTGVSTLSATVTAGVLSGHTVLGAIAWESAAGSVPTITSITDSRGNTWTTTPDVSAGGSLNTTAALVIVRARIMTALQVGDTITVTISGGTRAKWAMQFDDFNDINVTPLDKTATTGNTAPSSAALSTGATAVTSQGYELLYAAFETGFNKTFTIPSGWSGGAKVETGTTSGNRDLQVIWKYQTTAAAETGTVTIDTASTYAACIATYKATNPAPPVGRVSQVRLAVPQATAPAIVRVSRVSFQVPVGVIGVVRVAQVQMKAPTLTGQAPYSGVRFLGDDGVLYNSIIKSVVNGTI